jgi:2-methylisocitrate lyase-like PEP mutase family enzyme
MLQHLGFVALASTSSGFAWTTGRPDHGVTRDEMLQHVRSLCSAVDLPINADFTSGFASAPEDVVTNVRLAVETGVAGLSIEDRDIDAPGKLYDRAHSVERIRAARAAIDATGHDVILVARTEGLLLDANAVTPAIDKLVAFADAGADCLFAPGVRDRADIAAMVRAVAPKPLNVLMLPPWPTLAELADLGVRRISVGGGLARLAWAAMVAAARNMKAGSFDDLARAMPGTELNETFRH